MDSTNILYGKKWAVCGDSFTNGDFSGGYSETFEDGPFAGKYKTYGYLIAERNQMTVQHLAVGGQTMAMPPVPGTFSNSFSNGIYKTIDEDVDYITSMIHTTDRIQPEVTGRTRPELSIWEPSTIPITRLFTVRGTWYWNI